MTSICSATSAMTPRSWLIRISAAPVCSLIVRRVSRIIAWTVTSRAVVGSSAMISSGEFAIAIAMTTRWRMPPDSSCGYRPASCAACGRPTSPSRSTARRQAA
jgi:hypothetical protein